MEESNNMQLSAVVLAAGKGTRMKSRIPKILSPILGTPMINYILRALGELRVDKIIMVVGDGEDEVRNSLKSCGINFVRQPEQLGTGHAVNCCKSTLNNFNGNVLITNGDFPLITVRTLDSFVRSHMESGSMLTLLTAEVDDPSGYGRVVRGSDGSIMGVVEEKDCTDVQKEIKEINSGAYMVDNNVLWELIDQISDDNSQKEFYLPDIVKIADLGNYKISSFKAQYSDELLGVNDRNQLSVVESIMKTRINNELMQKGVSIIDPATTYISPSVSIGKDTSIYPHSYIFGNTLIGENCIIGPSVWIEDCDIGNNVKIKMSCFMEKSRVYDNVQIGPFAHIRPDTTLLANSKIGNFVEIKKSTIGQDSKVPHLSYVGDAFLGENVNIGAGSITCNYDGFNKHQTIIEDGVFIGSDTMLVAPLRIGKNATTGAGSTITKDVEENTLAISRAKQTLIPNWKRKPK